MSDKYPMSIEDPEGIVEFVGSDDDGGEWVGGQSSPPPRESGSGSGDGAGSADTESGDGADRKGASHPQRGSSTAPQGEGGTPTPHSKWRHCDVVYHPDAPARNRDLWLVEDLAVLEQNVETGEYRLRKLTEVIDYE